MATFICDDINFWTAFLVGNLFECMKIDTPSNRSGSMSYDHEVFADLDPFFYNMELVGLNVDLEKNELIGELQPLRADQIRS